MSEADATFERQLADDPYNLKLWLRYIDSKDPGSFMLLKYDASMVGQSGSLEKTMDVLAQRWILYERALESLPGSYKLWQAYLTERRRYILQKLREGHRGRSNAFGTAIKNSIAKHMESLGAAMHRMPRIWIDTAQFCASVGLYTRMREVFNQALTALPPGQHPKIWRAYLDQVDLCGIPEQIRHVYHRYLPRKGSLWSRYLQTLLNCEAWIMAAEEIQYALKHHPDMLAKHPSYTPPTTVKSIEISNRKRLHGELDASSEGSEDEEGEKVRRKSTHGRQSRLNTRPTSLELWILQWAKLVSVFAMDMSFPSSDTKAGFIESESEIMCKEHVDIQAQLKVFCSRALHRLGEHDRGLKVVETALEEADQVADFALMFEAHADQLEAHAARLVARADQSDDSFVAAQAEKAVESLDFLLQNRPLMLNRVLLNQNPHNVYEWLKRVALTYEFHGQRGVDGDTTELHINVLSIFEEATTKVDPKQTSQSVAVLWVEWAKFYLQNDQTDDARAVLDAALQESNVTFRTLQEVVCVWRFYIEMELRSGAVETARALLAKVTAPPKAPNPLQNPNTPSDLKQGSMHRLHRSVELWSLWADLEESHGSFADAKIVYEDMMRLHIATPRTIINYARLLQTHSYYEEAFRVYERGLESFHWPSAGELWKAYLGDFIKRHHGQTIERSRELFAECLESAPQIARVHFILQYADFELKHAKNRQRALDLYMAAATSALPRQRLPLVIAALQLCHRFFDVDTMRRVYEDAYQCLPDHDFAKLAPKWVESERQMGDIVRAQAVLRSCSGLADPSIDLEFWETWATFEAEHGNEDTFKAMVLAKKAAEEHFRNIRLLGAQAFVRATERKDSTADSRKTSGGVAFVKASATVATDDSEEREAED